MPYRNWSDQPGERRCVSCDQRLVADARETADSATPASDAILHFVCPDNHERWMYKTDSREWRQMY
jgi:hypothetical protein